MWLNQFWKFARADRLQQNNKYRNQEKGKYLPRPHVDHFSSIIWITAYSFRISKWNVD